MSFTPLFVVNGTTYTITELENLINNYDIWQLKYYNSEASVATLNLQLKELKEYQSQLDTQFNEGYRLGLAKAKQLIQDLINKEL
jgi:oligoribonuclease NrnB/cAMP/cGMP phosphodiesterase (DHH superfamily)